MTATTNSDRALAQRRAALARADHIRTARKEIKAKLKARELTVHELLDSPDVQTWKVADLLKRQVSWGPIRTKEVMSVLRMREGVRVVDLSESRRRELVAAVTSENERLARRERTRYGVSLRDRLAEAGIAA
jgi:hypothetical protein